MDAGPGPTDPGEVPEPATAAMLLGGLGLMYASRKRRFGK
ncbi:PEP-CTERM sorting domain-containing protein [Massilia forsythiae]|uniref:PEP-CTERM sorting domain-containing protein n=1 Tax=Massilia forsythiae TaxID=2728020 RepID=A0A7Z2VZ31_9BURK|nr:PEP-CTERM sorting domain-containing protein [Massilia forsythiae]QJE01803.1 PEP-CTERM sorting domain-containing protein [Massilia forsythiae]